MGLAKEGDPVVWRTDRGLVILKGVIEKIEAYRVLVLVKVTQDEELFPRGSKQWVTKKTLFK